MVAWLTMIAGRCLLTSRWSSVTPSVCARRCTPLNACVFIYASVCVSQRVCAWPRVTCFRKGNEIHCVFSSSPMVSHFFLLLHLHFPCCNRRPKSLLRTQVLTGYYFSAGPQKLQQLSDNETFTFIFLTKKWKRMRQERNGGQKASTERSRTALLRKKKDLNVSCLKWRWRAKI